MGKLKLEARGLTPLLVIDNGERRPAYPLRKLRAGMRLVVQSSPEALVRAKIESDFANEADVEFCDTDLAPQELAIGEAVLMLQSHLVRKTLRQADLSHQFGVTILALSLRGHAHPARHRV